MPLRSLATFTVLGLAWLSLAADCTPSHAQSTSTTPSSSPQLALATPANPRLRNLFVIGNLNATASPAGDADGILTSFFDLAKINVVSRILPTADIHTYLSAGGWQDTLAHLKRGDVVLIQFGPGSPSAAQAVLPGVGDDLREIDDPALVPRATLHTYGWYLRQYVVETIARGAAPILCVPPANTPGAEPYPAWVQAIATEQRIGYLDLPAIAATQPQAGTSAQQGVNGMPSAIVAGLKGLALDPLAGYFSVSAAGITPYRPPPPAPTPTP